MRTLLIFFSSPPPLCRSLLRPRQSHPASHPFGQSALYKPNLPITFIACHFWPLSKHNLIKSTWVWRGAEPDALTESRRPLGQISTIPTSFLLPFGLLFLSFLVIPRSFLIIPRSLCVDSLSSLFFPLRQPRRVWPPLINLRGYKPGGLKQIRKNFPINWWWVMYGNMDSALSF